MKYILIALITLVLMSSCTMGSEDKPITKKQDTQQYRCGVLSLLPGSDSTIHLTRIVILQKGWEVGDTLYHCEEDSKGHEGFEYLVVKSKL